LTQGEVHEVETTEQGAAGSPYRSPKSDLSNAIEGNWRDLSRLRKLDRANKNWGSQSSEIEEDGTESSISKALLLVPELVTKKTILASETWKTGSLLNRVTMGRLRLRSERKMLISASRVGEVAFSGLTRARLDRCGRETGNHSQGSCISGTLGEPGEGEKGAKRSLKAGERGLPLG